MAPDTRLATGLLWLLRNEPTLLNPAPENLSAGQFHRRRMDEVHSCLRCPRRAKMAYIAHTSIGSRWLDLCMECADWLKRSLDDKGF